MVWLVVGTPLRHTRCHCSSQDSLPSRILSPLHPHSRTAIWSALSCICHQCCSRPLKPLLLQTPCIHPALPIEGWRSASLPFSHPLGYNPGPSSVSIIHHEWASSEPRAWTSKIDLPFLESLDDFAHVPTLVLPYQLEYYRTNLRITVPT